MISATILVYRDEAVTSWGAWQLHQLPAPGDLMCLTDRDGATTYGTVRHTEHQLAVATRFSDNPHEAIIILDWRSVYASSSEA